MIIPIVVLGIVFLLIALRDIGKVKLQIWQVMLGGAVVVLVTGQISPIDAFHAINFDVIFFLFGMFIVGQATEDSGYLIHLCHKVFGKVKSVDRLVLAIFPEILLFPHGSCLHSDRCFSQNRTAYSVHPSAFVPIPSPKP